MLRTTIIGVINNNQVGIYERSISFKNKIELFQRDQKVNDEQPLSNFEAEIASDAKQLEAQPKKVVAYIKKNVYFT